MGKKDHVLVCLSSAPSNEKVIRIAADMARAYGCPMTALFIETPDFADIRETDRDRLWNNRRLAEELGARYETVYGEDIPYQIAEFARTYGVTRIVLGQSGTGRGLRRRPDLAKQLMMYTSDLEIYIIPDKAGQAEFHRKQVTEKETGRVVLNTLKSLFILLGASVLGLIFYRLQFTNANIIMVYILAVLLISISTSHRAYSLVSSIASVFIFNFLFTAPRYSLLAHETGYPVTFVVMFLTAWITGTFASRYKAQAREAAKNAYRSKILFDTNQLLTSAGGRDEIFATATDQIAKLLGREAVVNREEATLAEETPVEDSMMLPIGKRKASGKSPETLHFPIRANEHAYGSIAIRMKDREPLNSSEYEMLLAVLGECAMALENERNAREKEAAAVLAESEQLRANLLRTISHDLRTPLTSISGNASNLLHAENGFDEETRHQIYQDIYEDSMWLIELVENLLYATRIEEGRMTLRTDTELLDDIVEEALHHISHKTGNHIIRFTGSDSQNVGEGLGMDYMGQTGDSDMILVRADAKLVVQVMVNIIDNAIKYTQPESEITISTSREGSWAVVRIADNGKGIPDAEKAQIFDKFYCGNNKIADNRRSLGLGLYLCKAIVEAHEGRIRVEDNCPHGTAFIFTLPLEEVSIHE